MSRKSGSPLIGRPETKIDTTVDEIVAGQVWRAGGVRALGSRVLVIEVHPRGSGDVLVRDEGGHIDAVWIPNFLRKYKLEKNVSTELEAVIEEAVVNGTLPNSINGTVRNVAGKIVEARGLDAAGYDRVKTVIRDAYASEGTVEVRPADFAKKLAALVEGAIALGGKPTKKPITEDEDEPVVEKPTVESLTASLAMLGETAESAPEVLVDRLNAVLARFGIEAAKED